MRDDETKKCELVLPRHDGEVRGTQELNRKDMQLKLFKMGLSFSFAKRFTQLAFDDDELPPFDYEDFGFDE